MKRLSVVFKSITGTIVGAIILIFGVTFLASDQLSRKEALAEGVQRIYFVDNISFPHQELIRRFNEEYRGKIEVVPVDLPFTKFSTNERKQLLTKSLRSKSDRIDVFAVDLIWVPRFARWAEPLNSYFNINERAQPIEAAMQTCYYNDQLIAIPFYIDVGLMYYRKDILSGLPNAGPLATQLRQSITWEELIALHEANPDIFPFYTYAAKNFEGLVCSFLEGLLVKQPDIFTRDTLNLNTPAARETLQLLVDLVHKYRMTPLIVTQFDETQNYFYSLEHDALFIRGWPGLIRHYQNSPYREKLNHLRLAALPHWRGYPPVSVYGGWNLMIAKFSTKKRAAVTFIKFLMRPENQKLLFELGGYIPVSNAVYQDSVFFRQNPELRYYRKLLARGIYRPLLVNYTKISDVLSYYLRAAIRQEMSVETALARATSELNAPKAVIR